MKPQKISENAVPLQIRWHIVTSVLRIILNYRIALCKLKGNMEAIKRYYFLTENAKSEKAVLWWFISKGLFYTFGFN